MDNDRVNFAVAVGLVLISCVAIGGIVIISAAGHDPPPNLGTIVGTATGALAMLLYSGRSGRNGGSPPPLIVPHK